MPAPAPPVLWQPGPERVSRTALWRFLQEHGLADYDAAWRWSVAEPDAFWRAVGAFFDLRWEVEPEQWLADARMPGASWCPGGRISYAEHVFRLGANPEALDPFVALARERAAAG